MAFTVYVLKIAYGSYLVSAYGLKNNGGWSLGAYGLNPMTGRVPKNTW